MPVLAAVGPRLRALRQQRGATLAQLAGATGISLSILSRLESGQRRPTVDLLLRLARTHHVALDELVGAPATGGPVKPSSAWAHGHSYAYRGHHLDGTVGGSAGAGLAPAGRRAATRSSGHHVPRRAGNRTPASRG